MLTDLPKITKTTKKTQKFSAFNCGHILCTQMSTVGKCMARKRTVIREITTGISGSRQELAPNPDLVNVGTCKESAYVTAEQSLSDYKSLTAPTSILFILKFLVLCFV